MSARKNNRFRIVCFGLLILFGISGCATTDSGRTKAEGAMAGAALGALIGTIVTGDKNKGAKIGAAFGGLIGYAVGEHVANKKAEYANQEEYLNAVIAQSEKVLKDARKTNSELKVKISELNLEIENMEKKVASSEQKKTTLNIKRTDIKSYIKNTDAKLLEVKNEIEIQKTVIEKEKDSSTPKLIQLVSSNVTDLEIEERTLKVALAQLAEIDSRRVY